MKSQNALRKELRSVRKILIHMHDRGEKEECVMLFGAQQALAWALGDDMRSPSELEAIVTLAAKMIEEREQP